MICKIKTIGLLTVIHNFVNSKKLTAAAFSGILLTVVNK